MVTTGAPNDKPMSAETEPPSCTVSSGLGLKGRTHRMADEPDGGVRVHVRHVVI